MQQTAISEVMLMYTILRIFLQIAFQHVNVIKSEPYIINYHIRDKDIYVCDSEQKETTYNVKVNTFCTHLIRKIGGNKKYRQVCPLQHTTN